MILDSSLPTSSNLPVTPLARHDCKDDGTSDQLLRPDDGTAQLDDFHSLRIRPVRADLRDDRLHAGQLHRFDGGLPSIGSARPHRWNQVSTGTPAGNAKSLLRWRCD
jgi:hypothetical protein